MGEKILNMRKARGWSQEELAERIGVTRQAVSRWESDGAKPDADKVIAVCDLFGVSADYLLRDRYSGESSTARTERQDNAHVSGTKSVTPGQWFALGASLLSGLVLFILKLIYILQNTNYYYQDSHGSVYTGYQGFLHTEELFLLWYLALAALLGGLGYLIVLPVIRKLGTGNSKEQESD
jgi:transcriptional regulator with XRE-family HTH domain